MDEEGDTTHDGETGDTPLTLSDFGEEYIDAVVKCMSLILGRRPDGRELTSVVMANYDMVQRLLHSDPVELTTEDRADIWAACNEFRAQSMESEFRDVRATVDDTLRS